MNFTDSQRAALAAPGNVLVIAGAGAGKTRTLVERCLTRVLDERDPAGFDEILMVTFTEAAATEMRQRIRARLADELAKQPGQARIEEQLALLDTAHISTLHGFCLELVRQHFHELGLDPQVIVLAESQTRPLALATLDALLQRHYAGATPPSLAVQSLIREQGRGSDEGIRGLVVKLHRHTQTLPNPAAWLDAQLARFRDPDPTLWRDWLIEGFNVWRREWLPALEAVAADAPNVAACVKALDGLEMPAALQAILDADAVEWPRGTKGKVRKPIEDFFDDVRFLQSLTSGGDGKDPLSEDWSWVRQPMAALLELAREFTAEFTRAKRDLGGVDFADLEQLALRLLRDPATGLPTATAQQWRRQLRFVFVDEYQDINAAQDAILTALSRDDAEGNRFLVGDIKQSIYRFRLADPRIFRDYEQRWRGPDAGGCCIALSDNFRSREALLEFVNPLFAALMRPGVGGVAYDDAARLRFGDRAGRSQLSCALADAGGDPVMPRVELHLLPKPGQNSSPGNDDEGEGDAGEWADLDAVEKEARLVARRLRELREQGHPVWDDAGKQFRAVEWRDMVVLMRSVGSRAESYAKEFHRAGVPLLAERAGFYDALEVMDLLNLLRLLDNPLQDVPLLAVLRSPLVGLSLAELAEIRVGSAAKPFWTAVQQVANAAAHDPVDLPEETPTRDLMSRTAPRNPALAEKVSAFLKSFESWRVLLRQSSLSHCLEAVLVGTHYEALLRAGPRGAERAANVRRLLDLARQYDPYQRQGLFRFLRFIEAQQDAELDHESAPPPTENAVRLMTIHKSKGLEFPVVVLAGLGVKFNFKDLREDILLDEVHGLCPRVTPPGADLRYPSLPYWLAKNRGRRELLGEELRLLYVALTRARDTLILAGTMGNKSDAKMWAGAEVAAISERQIVGANSFLDWLRLCLPQFPAALFHATVYDEQDARWSSPGAETPSSPGKPPVAAEPSSGELDELIARITWQYPFPAATVEPAKTSVSALRRRSAEADEEARPLFQSGIRSSTFKLHTSAGGSSRKLSAAQIGTAHHLFLQFVELTKTATELDLRNEATRMGQGGILSEDEVVALDFAALAAFWQSELGRRLRAMPKGQIHREMPFTARLSPADLTEAGLRPHAGLPPDEFVVVQGVADLVVIRPEEIWLVDFKTDEVAEQDLAGKVNFYSPQLKLYALALGRIYQRPVKERWLHFLATGQAAAV